MVKPEPGNELKLNPPAGAPPKPGSDAAALPPKADAPTAAKAATQSQVAATLDEIVTRATADAAGVRARWLAPVHRELDALIAAVEAGNVSDDALMGLAEAMRLRLPGVKLNTAALRTHLEEVGGAAALVAAQQHARQLAATATA
jgi:hypothetical protein